MDGCNNIINPAILLYYYINLQHKLQTSHIHTQGWKCYWYRKHVAIIKQYH